ncbi:secretin [beta proteobacterium AAP99]|nr:secretin [beta proteobacterium AAP99]
MSQSAFARIGRAFVAFAALSCANVFAQENALENVSTSTSGGATTLTLKFKAPLKGTPANFSITNPARVAIDFPGTSNALGRNVVEVGQGDLRSLNVVQAGDRSRIVLNLSRPVPYSINVSGAIATVVLSDAQATARAAESRATASTTAAVAAPRSIRDIDFRRGPDGEGRVVIELGDTQTPVDIRQQGQTVVVEMSRAALPDNLRRRLDVTDFGTPVQRITTTASGETVRMVIEPRGNWEHSAFQTDRQLVVDVRALKEDQARAGSDRNAKPSYKGERLSLNFQSVEVRSILQVIADFTNLNIITSDTVTGSITLRLKDVPWDQALDIILQTKGLDKRQNGNVILVAPKEELATKEKLDLEQRAQIADLEPLRSEVIQLNYQRADDVRTMLNGEASGGGGGGTAGATRILSKRGSVAADSRTNQLFLQDTPAKLEEVRRFIARVDIAVRQVLIEARIVEADDRFGRNLGVRLGFNDARSTIYTTIPDPNNPGQTITVPTYGVGNRIAGSNVFGTLSGSLQGVQDLSSQNGSGVQSGTSGLQVVGGRPSVANTNFVNLPAGGISGVAGSPASVAISLFGSRLGRFINLELSALEAERRGKIVSSPRLLTADQVKAVIEQGTEYPYQQATSSGATSISFRKAVLKLEVTPQITPEGAIILDVEVNKDSRGELTSNGPAIDTKRVRTKVLVENGGTVVIGGIYQIEERVDVSKVPLLGDLPYVGVLFRNQQKVNDKTELLIFLTPKTVSDRLTASQ